MKALDAYRQLASPATRKRLRRLAAPFRKPHQAPRAAARPVEDRATVAPTENRSDGVLDCVIAVNQYGAYCVPRSSQHRPVARIVMGSGVWEADTLELMASQEGDIVHAGVFFGDFLPRLARSRGAGAIVWAFEPNRENYRCAQITAALNGIENVVLTHAALSATNGSGLLQTVSRAGRSIGGASHLVAEPRGETEHVDLVTVDETVADRHVSVLQLDVEGHEEQALLGALRTVERCRPLILLETLPEQAWIAEHLEPLGYRASGSVDANTILRPTPQA